MNDIKQINGVSCIFTKKPKKLIFLLHGYGDCAENFIPLANYLNDSALNANFFAPNAPLSVQHYPLGRQWFNPYPNGIHYNEAGTKEKATMENECATSIKKLKIYVNNLCSLNSLSLKDCFFVGFSQGAMIAYELGMFMESTLAGCVMLSGRILSSIKLEKNLFVSTPLMIVHGNNDDVVHPKYFYEACKIAKFNGFLQKLIKFSDIF